MIYKDVEIVEFNVQHGRVAILRGGLNKPKSYMDDIVREYVGREMYNEFIEIFLDNPYVRVVVSGINNFDYKTFNTAIHHLQNDQQR